MKKILQILPSDSPGIQQLSELIADSFPHENYRITTAYLNPTVDSYSSEKTKYFNFNKKETKGLRLKALWQMFKYCQTENFDVIITHRFKPLYLILIINKLLKIPRCISIIHGFDDFSRNSRKQLLKIFWTNNWEFVAISDAVNNYLRRQLKRTAKVTTINNAINLSLLTQSLKSKELSQSFFNINKKSFVFGTIGRLVPLKRHLFLVKAFSILLQRLPNCHLIIIGEGRSRIEIERYIHSHGLQSNITLTGHVDGAANYINGFDTFILPSLKEGFGLVLLEAMLAKVPIIASRTGGIPQVLGDTGQLIALNITEQDLAAIMLDQAELSVNKRLSIGESLYERALDNFDAPSYKEKWLTLLEQ